MGKKILSVIDDPGGGIAVFAVVEKLMKETDLEISVYSGKLSSEIADKANFKIKKIESMINKETAENIMNNEQPDLLLTATGGGNAEQEFRNLAFKKKIPSIVILDFWKDYSRRWMYADHEIYEITDRICVMDELTKKEMAEEGFPEHVIEVTGHPYLDKIFSKEKIHGNKNHISYDNILFLSQPLEIIGIKDYENHPLKILFNVFEYYIEELNSEIELNLVIKLHPSEEISEEIKSLVRNNINKKLTIRISEKTETLQELISESDIVFGYNSIAMFEARAAGKRAISLDLFPKRDSLTKAFSNAGIESAALNEKELIEKLNSIKDPELNREYFRGGIENCFKIISEELNLNRELIRV